MCCREHIADVTQVRKEILSQEGSNGAEFLFSKKRNVKCIRLDLAHEPVCAGFAVPLDADLLGRNDL
jgi:hypothetical protein